MELEPFSKVSACARLLLALLQNTDLKQGLGCWLRLDSPKMFWRCVVVSTILSISSRRVGNPCRVMVDVTTARGCKLPCSSLISCVFHTVLES